MRALFLNPSLKRASVAVAVGAGALCFTDQRKVHSNSTHQDLIKPVVVRQFNKAKAKGKDHQDSSPFAERVPSYFPKDSSPTVLSTSPSSLVDDLKFPLLLSFGIVLATGAYTRLRYGKDLTSWLRQLNLSISLC